MSTSSSPRRMTVHATTSGLDDEGKAVFGTPGPGRYESVSSFGKTAPVYESMPSYKFGVKHNERLKPFISSEHAKTEVDMASPGPRYMPKTGLTKRGASAYSFGSADRGAERTRYISKVHCRENIAATTPGPGTYRRKEGKGIAKTLGDAPTIKFGTGKQREFIGERDNFNNPGPGAHDHHPRLGDAPHYSFAPYGDSDLGMSRSRDQEKAVFISHSHASLSKSGVDEPGPGDYNLRSCLGTKEGCYLIDSARSSKYNPAHTFSKAKMYGDMERKPFLSQQHVDAERSVPGPIYTVPSKLLDGAPGMKFGEAQRFYEPEKGGNNAGPVVSSLHSESTKGAYSPGPAHYVLPGGKGIAKTLCDAPEAKFGTSQRDPPYSNTGVPGPGTYAPKQAAETSGAKGMFSRPPGYSVASCIRSDLSGGKISRDEPGPGAYETSKGIEEPDVRKRFAPSFRFGKDKDRGSFMKSNENPGPGSYHSPRSEGGPHGAPAYSFAPRRSDPSTQRMHSTGSVHSAKTYLGPLHTTEKLGVESPGPCAYQLRHGKGIARTLCDAPMTRFGTGKRGNPKEFIGPQHSKTDAGMANNTPGPGAYKVRSYVAKPNGGFSFGTSSRPPMASVRF